MHWTSRRFYVYSFVCFLSLAMMAFANAATKLLGVGPVDRVEVGGSLLFGAGFAVVAFLALSNLLLDALRATTLRSMNTQELRWRLREEPKSPRYAAGLEELRGVRVGAIFFGMLCVLGILRIIVWGW